MKNKTIIESIQCLLLGYQNISSSPNPNKKDLNSLRYLIGQSIREYDIPNVNRHVSQAAQKRWDGLSTNNIFNYHYKDIVVCDRLSRSIKYELFEGANKKGKLTRLSKNSRFEFRKMFHEDHVIPVSLILDELLKLTKVNYSSIEKLLNDIHICVLLKEEDRKISRTKGRELCHLYNIKEIYNKNGIFVSP